MKYIYKLLGGGCFLVSIEHFSFMYNFEKKRCSGQKGFHQILNCLCFIVPLECVIWIYITYEVIDTNCGIKKGVTKCLNISTSNIFPTFDQCRLLF